MWDVRRSGTYWAGDQLLVVGGDRLDLESDEMDVLLPTAEAQSFDPETGDWREIGPVPTDGYDGILPSAGAWTGSELIMLAMTCNNDYWDMEASCPRVALTWTPEEGWHNVDLPPVDALNQINAISLPRAPDGTAVFNTPDGMLIWDSNAEAGSNWRMMPQPVISDGSHLIGMCSTAERWFLAGASDPSLMTGTKTYASVNANGQDEIIYGQFPVSPDRPSISPGGPICLDDAVLYRPDLDQPIVRISLDGDVTTFTPPNAPTTGIEGGVPPSLSWAVVVGNAAIIPMAENFYYLDNQGKAINLPPSPTGIEPLVPASDLLYAQLDDNYDHPRAGQWYVLNLTDPENATFPLPADLPSKKNS